MNPAHASAVALLATLPHLAAADYDRHVLFDNAPAPGGYYNSETTCIAPSRLESVAGRLPASAERWVSPPSSLKLAWRSAPGGDWRATIKDAGRDWRKFEMLGDTLVFWCFADTEITELNSPRLSLVDAAGARSVELTLVRGAQRLPAGRWERLQLRFDPDDVRYRGTADNPFKLSDTVALVLTQGLDDDEPHTLFLDDIMIVDGTVLAAPAAPSPAPATVKVTAYERHFDVEWEPGTAPGIFSYRIHRALGDGPFEPIGTQRAAWRRFSDFAGGPGTVARYRVTALDLAGRESAPSPASEAATARAMSDEELLEMTQLACFRYYWEAGHPRAGLAPEILPGDPHLLALGGNGFGVMALLVAAERGWVTREAAAERLVRILRFLEAAPRYHGAWAHFLDGRTAQTVPFFGRYDNGGDLVETAFMIQGLLAARRYFDRDHPAEREIRETATRFWREVEWDWYRQRPDSDFLYWHWSPDHGFHINHPLIGWNETLIVYLLAIASPTHPVPARMWHTGWAGRSPEAVAYRRGWGRTTQGDQFVNGGTYHGHRLEVGVGNGAELFFTHFSFLGFDPRGRRDAYTNYFANNRAIALISRAYSVENPRGFKGYGADCWGRSAGVNNGGGRALPRDDNGTINCMASLASLPYVPAESLAALRHFYRDLGPRVWGTFGFHDGFNEEWNWFDEDYMALNQAPIVVMIENHRTGLLWRLFMANPEIGPALDAIGFRPDPTR